QGAVQEGAGPAAHLQEVGHAKSWLTLIIVRRRRRRTGCPPTTRPGRYRPWALWTGNHATRHVRSDRSSRGLLKSLGALDGRARFMPFVVDRLDELVAHQRDKQQPDHDRE